MASGERFPCIVCQLLTSSIYELHNHQRTFHTSEELSMSVIYLVNYMCLQQNMTLGLRNVSNHSVWPGGYMADYQNQKRYTQTSEKADQIQLFPELRTDMQIPIDYTPSQSRYQKNKTATSTKVNEYQLEHCVASSSGLSQSKTKENDLMNTLSGSFGSNFEAEVDKVKEINDETFLQSVNGICRELKSSGKMPNVGVKQRNCQQIKMTGKKCPNKKTNKRKYPDQTNFYSSHPIPCYKNVGTVGQQNEGSEFLNDAMANFNSKDNKAPLKLASFAQTFQYLKQRKIKSKDQTVPLHKGMSIIQEALNTTDNEHRSKGKISASVSIPSDNLSGQSDISGKKKYPKMSDIDGKIGGI